MTRLIVAGLVALLAAAAPAEKKEPAATAQKNRMFAEKGKPKAKVMKLTGCVDQQGEDFVLTELTELKRLVTLRGAGYTDLAFARHVGHKVTVEGTLDKEGDKEVVRARNVKTISEFCVPEERIPERKQTK